MTSVIIATKSLVKAGRDLKRLYWQCYSLQSQDCEVIIMDGSNHAEYTMICNLVGRFSHVTAYNAEQRVMNLPELWNAGVHMAHGDFILISGADFIYHPDFLQTMKGLRGPDTFIACQVWMLPKMGISKKHIDTWSWPRVKVFPHGKLANGIQYATKDYFKANPYNEGMKKLGGMDNLQWYMAERAGMRQLWHESRQVMHVHHKWSKMKVDKQFSQNQQIIRDELKNF